MMSSKAEVLERVKGDYVEPMPVAEANEEKPWGAYYRITDEGAQDFINRYFPGRTVEELGRAGSLSPKILVFEPGTKLSLQYHLRRAEIWRVLAGTLLAAISDSDTEGEWHEYEPGTELSYGAETRHRAGAPEGEDWVVVAEIWQHTDPNNPTDEDDIVRLADDFGRA